MPLILTFDLGTTRFKACLFDETGSMKACAHRPTPATQPHPRWSQIDPVAFRQTIVQLGQELRTSDPTAWRHVERISFATQTNSFLLLDERGQPLTPLILWNDHRVSTAPDHVQAIAAQPDFYAETGIPALSGEFMVAKLHWLRQQEPMTWKRARRLCLISDYLTLWLTGIHLTEAGAAGLTGMVNIHTLAWRVGALRQLALEAMALPGVGRAGHVIGTLQRDAARALDLPQPCAVVLGCLDQYAGAIGAGNVRPGALSQTTGTVLTTVRLADSFDPNAAAPVIQGPAFEPGWYYRMIVGNVSANLLEAYRRQHAADRSFAQLDEEAARAPAGSDGLRLDHDASAQSGTPVFQHANPTHTRGHHVRAILEAVATALAAQVKQLHPQAGPAEVRCVGGAARSDLWLQIKAQTLGTTMVAMDCPEPTSLGAAMLAMMPTTNGSLTDLSRRWVQVRKRFSPASP